MGDDAVDKLVEDDASTVSRSSRAGTIESIPIEVSVSRYTGPSIVLTSTALRLDGWTVEVSESAADALAVLQRFRPDVIVLDVMLGDADGFELCQLLRRRAVTAPVIFLTARGAVDDRVRGLTTGGDDYLTKPFSVEELVARCRLLARRGHAGDTRSAVLAYADLEMDEDAHCWPSVDAQFPAGS